MLHTRLLPALISLFLACTATTAFADAKNAAEHFTADVDYEILKPDLQQEKGIPKNCKKPEIITFFSYGCPGCQAFEPFFEAWHQQNQSTITLKRVPVTFHPGWDILAKFYYAANSLGILEQTHAKSFEWAATEIFNGTLNETRVKPFITQLIAQSPDLKNKKITPDLFMETYGSNTVNRDVQQSMRLFKAYQMTASPAVVVADRYSVSVAKAKTLPRMIKIINFLTEEERKRVPCQ